MSFPSFFDSIDGLKQFLSHSSLDKFKESLAHCSFSELADMFVLLFRQPSLHSKEKLESLFQFVDSPHSLELLAKHFSVSHFIAFLDFLHQHPLDHERLTFILIGLPSTTFSQALHVLQQNHLALLKFDYLLEPLHYHLLQFVHKGEALLDQLEQQVSLFQKDVQRSTIEELTTEVIDGFIQRIDHFKTQILDYLECASTALSIVWNTPRIDLIEKVSDINETLQHQLMEIIGHSSFDFIASTGLYSFLEKTFSHIYDSSLSEHDAALEGLTRLSIWHLRDYWEIGLLPSIRHAQELDLNPQQHSEEARQAYQQGLLLLVQQHLERLQITTIGDLKKAYLFSKPLLKAYINHHQACLTQS